MSNFPDILPGDLVDVEPIDGPSMRGTVIDTKPLRFKMRVDPAVLWPTKNQKREAYVNVRYAHTRSVRRLGREEPAPKPKPVAVEIRVDPFASKPSGRTAAIRAMARK